MNAANFGLWPNMTLYLVRKYNMRMTTASNILFYESAATNLMPAIAAVIADSFVGRFNVIGFGSIVCILVRTTSPFLDISILSLWLILFVNKILLRS